MSFEKLVNSSPEIFRLLSNRPVSSGDFVREGHEGKNAERSNVRMIKAIPFHLTVGHQMKNRD